MKNNKTALYQIDSSFINADYYYLQHKNMLKLKKSVKANLIMYTKVDKNGMIDINIDVCVLYNIILCGFQWFL